MARRGQHSFVKRQKEVKRKEQAADKMSRRRGKKTSSESAEDRSETQETDDIGNGETP